MQKISLKIKGMKCTGCENRVKKALQTIKGVEEVSASFESGIVTLNAKEEIEKDLVTQKIENLGFEIIKED